MPNWVSNIIVATDGNFEALKELLVNEKGEVDFNKVIPMPSDLNIISGSYSYITDKYGWNKEEVKKQEELINPILEKFYNSELTQAGYCNIVTTSLSEEELNTFKEFYGISEAKDIEHLENVIKGYYNIKKYGHRDWYDWRIKNWGTKWNVNPDDMYITENTICFQTAWSCPVEVLLNISKKVPVTVAYADEDLGSNYGIIMLKDGLVVDSIIQNNGSIGEAISIHGYESVDDCIEEEDWENEEAYKQALIDFDRTENLMNKYIWKN